MKLKNCIWLLLALLALASCKEEDDAVEEYANWQSTNDEYFSRLVSDVQKNSSLNVWELIPCYTVPSFGPTAQILNSYSPGSA